MMKIEVSIDLRSAEQAQALTALITAIHGTPLAIEPQKAIAVSASAALEPAAEDAPAATAAPVTEPRKRASRAKPQPGANEAASTTDEEAEKPEKGSAVTKDMIRERFASARMADPAKSKEVTDKVKARIIKTGAANLDSLAEEHYEGIYEYIKSL